jgi:hypothetical protein
MLHSLSLNKIICCSFCTHPRSESHFDSENFNSEIQHLKSICRQTGYSAEDIHQACPEDKFTAGEDGRGGNCTFVIPACRNAAVKLEAKFFS